MGFFLTTRGWILYLNTLTIFGGLVIYYAIYYGSLYALSKLDVIIFKPNVSDARGTAGLLLILFALAIVINFENPYVQYLTMGTFTGASQVFYQTEDGVAWLFASSIMKGADIEQVRIVAFSVIPALIAMLGFTFIEGKIKISV